jgi:anthranilate/para-aminobenzoate synthase component II
MLGKIVPQGAAFLTEFIDPNQRNLVAEVRHVPRKCFTVHWLPTVQSPLDHSQPPPHCSISKASRTRVEVFAKPDADIDILAVDCGMKDNIIRHLVERGARVKVVPWDYDISLEHYDGLFYSNGPGDPALASITVDHLRKALHGDTPIFGICMGHQLLSLAAGATTYKLPFGNRGQNQPCINLEDRRCYITPQNHGFAVDADTLPTNWKPLFINANDGSNEGCKHIEKPFFSVQFHPEANGGPQDTAFLFDRFLNQVRLTKARSPLLSMPIGPSLAAGKGLEGALQSHDRMRFPSAPVIASYPPMKKVGWYGHAERGRGSKKGRHRGRGKKTRGPEGHGGGGGPQIVLAQQPTRLPFSLRFSSSALVVFKLARPASSTTPAHRRSRR